MSSTNLQVATVDLINNFQVTGKQMCKQVDWPALQSLRKDGVIGVGAGTHTDVPGLDTIKKLIHIYILYVIIHNIMKMILELE